MKLTANERNSANRKQTEERAYETALFALKQYMKLNMWGDPGGWPPSLRGNYFPSEHEVFDPCDSRHPVDQLDHGHISWKRMRQSEQWENNKQMQERIPQETKTWSARGEAGL